jgi:DNA polymerase
VPASGSGENGVLIVAEAAGEHEAEEGMPLVGKAGYYFWSQLHKVGIERDGFKVHNVLSCRPPDNKLARMPYEEAAINHCAVLLDSTIADMFNTCRHNGKHLTILALGRIAFRRILELDEKSPILKDDYQGYVFWSEKYAAWVIGTYHPSYLMRGKHHLVQWMQFAVKRALEIAEKGFKYHDPVYIRDPTPAIFASWVRDFSYYYSLHPSNTYLVFDIETPHKQGKDEEKVAKEHDDDYTILRISFSYLPGQAVSVPWRAEYMAGIEELMGCGCTKVAHNMNYDVPRILAQ